MLELQEMVAQAEAGDTALWEDIARALLKARKPRKAKKDKGAYVYSSVTFADGVMILVGGYALTPDSQTALDKAARLRAGVMSGRWFDPQWLKMIPAAVAASPVLSDDLETIRMKAHDQRVNGWGRHAWSTYVEAV